ncbi:MAG: hypothetical protein LBR69_03270 [Endomicrobium sp.]|nr:hypothetical protein [Endomicrobium sp.]
MNAGCGDARAPDTIVISSAPAGLTNGSSALLTATLYSGGIGGTPVIMDHEEEILWEVSGPGTISAASGNSVTFTANAAPAFGQASVKVSVGNVSAVVNIFVADAAMPSKDARMILTDAGLDSAVNDQFPIWGDWHQYPSGEDSSRQPQPPVTSNLVLSDALGQGITIDPEKALQLDFTQPTGTGNYWAGFTLQFATPVSGFSYLNFYAKGNTGNIIAEVVDSSNGKTAIPFPIGSNWKFCYIPVTGKNIKEINFMFRKDDNSQTGTAYLDFIYFDNEIPGSL